MASKAASKASSAFVTELHTPKPLEITLQSVHLGLEVCDFSELVFEVGDLSSLVGDGLILAVYSIFESLVLFEDGCYLAGHLLSYESPELWGDGYVRCKIVYIGKAVAIHAI